MEFQEVMKIRERMCEGMEDCSDCPLDSFSDCKTPRRDELEKYEKAIVKWAGDEECTSIAQGACKAAEIVANAPTVDAVPVVRCKECKYRHTFDCMCRDRTYDDWFCADGKLKEARE